MKVNGLSIRFALATEVDTVDLLAFERLVTQILRRDENALAGPYQRLPPPADPSLGPWRQLGDALTLSTSVDYREVDRAR